MKKILYSICITALLSSESNAQTNTSINELLSTDKNHIATRTYTHETGTTWRDKIDYYDGLGRLEQSVLKYSQSDNTIVTYQEYDTQGRTSKQWLPVAFPNNGGKFILPDVVKSKATSTYSDSAPYSYPVYEASPLSRTLEQFGPGQQWQENHRSVKSAYLTNIAGTDTLNCIHFTAINVSDTVMQINRIGNYATGQLYVIRMEDEDGNPSFEFKDKLGQVVLTRQIKRTGGNKELYDTYYIYDDFGNQTAVLPPAASSIYQSGSTTSWMSSTNATLQQHAFLYQYDSRKLQIGKKLPGCSWSFYIYDKGKRLIFSQDGNQRCRGEWSFCIPDVFGRILLTGVCSNTFNYASSPLNHSVVKGTWSDTSSTTKGYSITGITLNAPIVLTANFYDNYNFVGKNDIPNSTTASVKYDSEYESEGFGRRHVSAYGLPTGTLTAQMNGSSATPNYLYSVKYYDSHGRLIQGKSSNHLTGGVEKEYIAYNFIGQPVKRKHIHSATGKAMQTELYSYIYNPAGELQSSTLQLNGGTPVTLISNEYDDLERLISTQRNNGNKTLTTTNDYNVRNWLKATENPLFSQRLYYTDGTGTPCFNGNISSMTWKAGNEQTTRGYRFEYDPLSRLKSAAYGEGEVLALKPNHYDEQITGYDKNGNIQGIKRYGQTSASACGLIDDLSISLNGNQLQSVNDAITSSAFNGNFEFQNNSRQTEEYAYDANGNLVKDLNKKITDIQYNCLNLPNRIEFEDGSSISYLYDATGIKLRVVHQMAGNTTTTDYCGNVIYEKGTPKTLLTEAGFVSLNDNKYHYYLQDHQGNNRVVADQHGNVEEVNHYYPFGGIMKSSASIQPYKYNGKELDRKNGLDWYDYGARQYDAALGRWHAIDPSSEKYYNWSPYGYCKNNPVLRIDLDGKDDYIVSNMGQVRKVNETNRTVDILYYAGDNFTTKNINPQWKNIRVFDKAFLKNFTLENNRGDDVHNPQYFGETSSLYDAANVAKFVMDNTGVEWSLDAGFRDEKKSYVVGTNHKEDAVSTLQGIDGSPFESFETNVRIHSHPNEVGGTKGGSPGDVENAKGKNNIFFGVYFKGNQTLYEYNSKNSKANETKINSLFNFMKLINTMNQ